MLAFGVSAVSACQRPEGARRGRQEPAATSGVDQARHGCHGAMHCGAVRCGVVLEGAVMWSVFGVQLQRGFSPGFPECPCASTPPPPPPHPSHRHPAHAPPKAAFPTVYTYTHCPHTHTQPRGPPQKHTPSALDRRVPSAHRLPLLVVPTSPTPCTTPRLRFVLSAPQCSARHSLLFPGEA